jgi:hypothetical protein
MFREMDLLPFSGKMMEAAYTVGFVRKSYSQALDTRVQVQVALQLSVSQSVSQPVCLGVKLPVGLITML